MHHLKSKAVSRRCCDLFAKSSTLTCTELYFNFVVDCCENEGAKLSAAIADLTSAVQSNYQAA